MDTTMKDFTIYNRPTPRKSQQGKPIPTSERKAILGLYYQLRAQNPKETIRAIVKQTCEIANVSRGTVFKLIKEAKTSTITNPGKRPGSRRLKQYDDFTLSGVRKIIFSHFLKNEIPTARKLLLEFNNDEQLFPAKISLSTLFRLLKDLGFSYERKNKKTFLIEDADIILKRRRYLRDINAYRKECRNIYYLDQMSMNLDDTKPKVEPMKDAENSQGADIPKTGPKKNKIKTYRYIVNHAGNKDGFVPGVFEVFMSKKPEKHSVELDEKYFKDWFETKLLPNIKANSIIIMDNAPHHCSVIEKFPTITSCKREIQEWLRKKNISYTEDMLKVELMQKVKRVKEEYNIDSIASKAGHTVMRLPPHHHFELNPIEQIWSQIKAIVGDKKGKMKLKDMDTRLHEAIKQINAEKWQACIHHVMKKEEEFWKIDYVMEDVLERHFWNTNQSEDESDNSEDSCSELMS